MSETFPINVEPRTNGKHFSRKARLERKIPTVVYGPSFKNQSVLLEQNFVMKHSGPSHESTIFTINSDDKALNGTQVLLKAVQFDPVTDIPVHADLYALNMANKIRVNVVIDYQGTPKGVKDEGGLLQTVLTELEVECLPIAIPDNIVIDISDIALNGSLHVSEITLPDGIKAMTAPERTLCTVSQPKEEAAAEPAAEGAADDAAPATDGENKS